MALLKRFCCSGLHSPLSLLFTNIYCSGIHSPFLLLQWYSLPSFKFVYKYLLQLYAFPLSLLFTNICCSCMHSPLSLLFTNICCCGIHSPFHFCCCGIHSLLSLLFTNICCSGIHSPFTFLVVVSTAPFPFCLQLFVAVVSTLPFIFLQWYSLPPFTFVYNRATIFHDDWLCYQISTRSPRFLGQWKFSISFRNFFILATGE